MGEGISRETLATRLGFIMLSAGCAIGLGNVWRFPFIVGQFGGGIFVLLYFFFLIVLGFPALMTEMALGRGSRSNLVGAFRILSAMKKGAWVAIARVLISGSLILMLYYTCVSGWLFSYTGYYARGIFADNASVSTDEFFKSLIASPMRSTMYMLLATAFGSLICWCGLRKGVECCVKYMMCLLLALIVVLVAYALSMPGAKEGIAFYLKPDLGCFAKAPMKTIFAAMGQAFFTLSLGLGAMTIFGSYLELKRPLAKECAWIIALDTFVAFCAGLIVFPICKSYNIDVAQGPGLLFVSLPNAFNNMPAGRIWGSLFFLFMSLAALTTIVAVFENIVAYLQDEHKFARRNATLAVGITVAVFSLPCVFGYNVLSWLHPLGGNSTILDFEDFLVSQNLLPLGTFIQAIFCFSKYGWGGKNYVLELEAGQKWRIPKIAILYGKYVLPVIIVAIFIMGYFM